MIHFVTCYCNRSSLVIKNIKMGCKILKLLLLMALSSNSFGLRSLLRRSVMRTTLLNSDGKYDCFCMAKHRKFPLITAALGFERVKRLAVYLYQDQYSSKVKIYIPGTEKQLLFPDFEFEKGDRLEDVLPHFRIHNLLRGLLDVPIFNIKLGIHEYLENKPKIIVQQPDNAHVVIKKRPSITNVVNGKWTWSGNNVHGGQGVGVSTSRIGGIYAKIIKHNLDYDRIKNSKILDLSVFDNWFHHNLGDSLMETEAKTLKNYLLQLFLKSGVDITGQFLAQGSKESTLNLENIMTYYAVVDNALLLNDTNKVRVNFPNPDLEVLVVSTKSPVRILGYLPIDPSITKQLKITKLDGQENSYGFSQHSGSSQNELSRCNEDWCPKKFEHNVHLTLDRDPEENGEIGPNIISGGHKTNENDARKFLNNRVLKGLFQNKAYNLQDNSVKYVINREHEEEPGDDDATDEEEPGVRIVGGTAATGSGTPVNMKGRSGVLGQD